MNFIILFFTLTFILLIQGCAVKGIDKNEASKYDLLMQANQDFSCQQIVGAFMNISIKKGETFPSFSLPTRLKLANVIYYSETMNVEIPETAIFIKTGTTSALLYPHNGIWGFLIYPNGEFVIGTKKQHGYIKDNEFRMFTNCSWKGKTPFSPIRRKDIK